MKTKKIKSISLLACALCCAGTLLGQNVGQWDFDNGDLSQTAGANLGDMTYIDGTTGQTISNTVFDTTTDLGIPDINGTPAKVMEFPSGSFPMGYYMPTPPANGGGSLVNEYTVIMDVLYTNGAIFRPLIQMDDGTLDNVKALFDIGPKDNLEVTNTQGAAVLVSGVFGSIAPNTWYRLGLVLDDASGTVSVYINGTVAGIVNIGAGNLDPPYAMVANSTLPVFSSNITNAMGFVNSVQVRDEVLSPGEMEAIGGPSASGIPIVLPPAHSYIVSRTPNFGETGVSPEPVIHIVVNQGSATIDVNSFKLSLDGNLLPAAVSSDTSPNQFDVDYSVTSILDPQSVHTLQLVYSDSLLGLRTNMWSFTVANYQNVTLPAPIYFENFDEVAEGAWPAGWSVTNDTAEQTSGFDLNDPTSDAYLSFVVISSNRLDSVFTSSDTYSSPGLGTVSGERRLVHPPIVLNGVLLDSLVHTNVAYCDSDQRQNEGGQVDVMFSPDYDLTGHTNVYLAFNSTYEQNQDNIGSVEYSIDQGQTWLPALYMLDDGTTDGDGSDVVTNQATGQIDVFATFGTARDDQAYGLAYSNFIGAVVSTNLIPYISPRRNDDPLSSKRIEVIRLPYADNQPHVRFRFGQAGTSSWYFGIDDFGLYSITLPVISQQPQSQTVDANTPVSFTVVATGSPLTYQWRFNGFDISGATNDFYSIASASPTNAGTYQVVVGGVTPSSPAVLTVNTNPIITTDLSGQIVDPGATVVFPAQATGGRPLTYFLYHNNSLLSVSSSGTSTFTLNDVQAPNTGNYQLVVTNNYGAVTGLVASLRIYAGPLTNGLVVHLAFDGNFNDTSGRGNNAAYAYNGTAYSPTPRFVTGFLGQAFEFTTTKDESDVEYATLGYPPDLQFGETNDFSVSMWVNYTNQDDDPPLIANKDWESSDNRGWGIFTQSGGNYRINVTGPNGSLDKFSETDTPHTLKDGNWHNIVVSVQHAPFGYSAYVYGYLDGVLATKHPMELAGSIDTFGTPFSNSQGTNGVALPDNQSTWAVNIGQEGTGLYTDRGSAYNIDAKIDDVGIWRRALTANEAAGIYAAGMAGKDLSQVITPSTLVISVSGGNVNIGWVGSPTVKLQEATSLNPANWTDVPGTLGASSAIVPMSSSTQAFFRLTQ
jgi:Concanavalin A-like lectin/glucanases superfamily/Immunoglobulin domain